MINMEKIKQTKSVSMFGDRSALNLDVTGGGSIIIPMRVAHQVLRGMITYLQKYYRRKVVK